MTKGRILSRLQQDWKAFLASFQDLPDSLLSEPGVVGKWSVRDVLAHITTWDGEALKALPILLKGETPPRYAQYGGIDAFNAREQERKHGLPLEQVKQELVATHERLVSLLSGIPENAYSGANRFLRRLRLDTYGHYRQHTAQIAAWRAEKGL